MMPLLIVWFSRCALVPQIRVCLHLSNKVNLDPVLRHLKNLTHSHLLCLWHCVGPVRELGRVARKITCNWSRWRPRMTRPKRPRKGLTAWLYSSMVPCELRYPSERQSPRTSHNISSGGQAWSSGNSAALMCLIFSLREGCRLALQAAYDQHRPPWWDEMMKYEKKLPNASRQVRKRAKIFRHLRRSLTNCCTLLCTTRPSQEMRRHLPDDGGGVYENDEFVGGGGSSHHQPKNEKNTKKNKKMA